MNVHMTAPRPWRPAEFASSAEMLEHYKQVRARLRKGKRPAPEPVALHEPAAPMLLAPEPQEAVEEVSPAEVAVAEPPAPEPAAPHKRDFLWVSGQLATEYGEPMEAGVQALRWRIILKEVCEKHNITWEMMASTQRSYPIVRARQEAWWRMSRELRMSLPAIGRRCNRDHTSILHGIRKFQRLIDSGEVVIE